jgi:hypothetical protein
MPEAVTVMEDVQGASVSEAAGKEVDSGELERSRELDEVEAGS